MIFLENAILGILDNNGSKKNFVNVIANWHTEFFLFFAKGERT